MRLLYPRPVDDGGGAAGSEPDPTEEQIRYAFKDTLCRCGTYPAIVRAVQDAGRKLRTGEQIRAPELEPGAPANLRIVGHVVARPDAFLKVTGAAKFTDDYTFPEMLHARALRAMVPHAIVTRLDVTRAQRLPGVHAVLTAADVPGRKNHGLVTFDWPVLVGVGEKVRTVGDAVAIVAADTREIATEALALIEVAYEQLPVVSDPRAGAGARRAQDSRVGQSAQAHLPEQGGHRRGVCAGGHHL